MLVGQSLPYNSSSPPPEVSVCPSPYTDCSFGSFTGYEIVAAIPPANNFIYWYRNQPGYIPQLFAGEVTPVECFTDYSVNEHCGTIPQPRPDEEIKAITDERLLNQEALRKVRYYLYETGDSLAAKNLLEDINTDISRRFLAPYYVFEADIDFSNSFATTLPDERTEDQQYQWLYNLFLNLRQTGRTIMQVTPDEETTIRQIANDYTKASFEARTLLYLLHGEEYPVLLPPVPDIINPLLMQGVAVNFKNNNSYPTEKADLVSKPYPNPANGTINLASQLNQGDIAIFRLYDFTGHLVLEKPLTGIGQYAFEIAHLPQGIYFYQVLLNSEGLLNGKLILNN